ncbi:MAG TPA: DUF262 domain-containing HNH endonuclease family protein [Rhizomicrobium sp.]|jgi:uncharacterized protein with ParB-like and HNH nuclease domain
MDAHAVPLLAIFEKKMRLEVPHFQRQYVWTMERQWEPLWEDIKRKFVEKLDGRTDAPAHFLGAMVLDQKQTPTTHVERRQVIDGQQRLTTLQIFLSAFRDFCREQECDELAAECDSFTQNRGMMAEPEVDRFKVWPTQLDRRQFSDVVLSGSRKELEKRHPLHWRKRAKRPDPRPQMIAAYFYFYDELSEFFLGTSEEHVISADIQVCSRLEQCFQALKNSLKVVTIDLQLGDDPQVIFETLNARGEPLLPADLLRNFIFLRAARVGEDQEALYREYWSPFDEPFWREEVKQGRLVRPRSDLFMQHFLASRIGEDIPIKHLFVEYKHWIEKERPFQNIRDELATLCRQGGDFHRILAPTKDDPLYRLATFLEAFDIRTTYPLLLALLNVEVTNAAWNAITGILESYLVRRALCALGTKNYNRVFLQLTKTLRREGLNPDTLRTSLLSQSGPSSEWPNDGEFMQSWLNNNAYALGNQKLVHIFKTLNESYISNKAEIFSFEEQPTIEHIMPEAWVENWPLADGSIGLTALDMLIDESSDDRTKESQERNELVQTMGNLTILSQPLNSAQSNSSWNDKRPELMIHSLLPINQQLATSAIWDERAILSRGRELFDRASKVWPR